MLFLSEYIFPLLPVSLFLSLALSLIVFIDTADVKMCAHNLYISSFWPVCQGWLVVSFVLVNFQRSVYLDNCF